jgi:hypothetical protein
MSLDKFSNVLPSGKKQKLAKTHTECIFFFICNQTRKSCVSSIQNPFSTLSMLLSYHAVKNDEMWFTSWKQVTKERITGEFHLHINKIHKQRNEP